MVHSRKSHLVGNVCLCRSCWIRTIGYNAINLFLPSNLKDRVLIGCADKVERVGNVLPRVVWKVVAKNGIVTEFFGLADGN